MCSDVPNTGGACKSCLKVLRKCAKPGRLWCALHGHLEYSMHPFDRRLHADGMALCVYNVRLHDGLGETSAPPRFGDLDPLRFPLVYRRW